MITIALDENGDFEGFQQSGQPEPLFIAGIVYDDKGHENDAWNEMQRLDEYFRAVASEVECHYPIDLHMNHKGTNGYNVKRMKRNCRLHCRNSFNKVRIKIRKLVNIRAMVAIVLR